MQGDWTSGNCPDGFALVGGGCDAFGDPWKFQYLGPKLDASTRTREWQCSGHRADKMVFKTCVAEGSMQLLYVESKSNEDWHVVHCPSGMSVISGGCDAHGAPFRFSFNGPHPDDPGQWQCGGHGGGKNVFAVCAPIREKLTYVTQHIPDWGVAQCPSGTKILGGGCNVLNGNLEMQLSGCRP